MATALVVTRYKLKISTPPAGFTPRRFFYFDYAVLIWYAVFWRNTKEALVFKIDFEGARLYRENIERGNRKKKVDPFPPTDNLPTDILHYIGGILDSEGSFYFTDLRPAVSIYNNNLGMLERIAKITGGKPRPNHRGEHHLRIAALDRVLALCEKYAQYMHLKHKQAARIIDACIIDRNDRESISKEVSEMNARDKEAPRPGFDESLKMVDFSTITSSDAAYFCGFLEGDGTLVMTKQVHAGVAYYYPQVHLYNTSIDPLVWIQNKFGGKMEVRKRDGKCGWIHCLSFEDQAYVAALVETVKDHLYEKREIAEAIIKASLLAPTDRAALSNNIRECNSKFRGLHKFVKNPDGTYTDGKRSKNKPHKTHKGIPFKDKPEEDKKPELDEGVDF